MLAAQIQGAACHACFDLAGSFRKRDRHPFVLRGQGMVQLADFRAHLRLVMQRAGFAVSTGFTPHMTLIWADRCVEDNPIAPIVWPVEDFELVLSADGDHIQMGRWRLIS